MRHTCGSREAAVVLSQGREEQAGELNVKEKLRLLHAAMADYDSQAETAERTVHLIEHLSSEVEELLPFFVSNTERDRAEKRWEQLKMLF